MPSDPTLEFITFLLAILGYAGLTATVLLSTRGAMPMRFWRFVVPVIVVHVFMVWALRYEWQFSQATRNGYAGFLMFHIALTLIVASAFMNARRAVWLVRIAFLIVSAGALGATFLYEVVAIYRIPVIVFAVAGTGALIWMFIRSRSLRTGVT